MEEGSIIEERREYYSLGDFLRLLKNVCLNHPWKYETYRRFIKKTVLSVIHSFSTFKEMVLKDCQKRRVPRTYMFDFIPPQYHGHVEAFFRDYSKSSALQSFDGSCLTIARCIAKINAVVVEVNLVRFNQQRLDVLTHIARAYAMSIVVSRTLTVISRHIDKLFIEHPGMCPDKKEEWDRIQAYNKRQDIFVTPRTIVRYAKRYDHYKSSLCNPPPIVDVTRRSEVVSAAPRYNLREMVERTPKRFGLDINNLQETRLRQRRRQVSSKFH